MKLKSNRSSTPSGSLDPWYRECVEYHGVTSRLAAIRSLDVPFTGVDTIQMELEAALVELGCRAVAVADADVVILGGSPLAGLPGRSGAGSRPVDRRRGSDGDAGGSDSSVDLKRARLPPHDVRSHPARSRTE